MRQYLPMPAAYHASSDHYEPYMRHGYWYRYFPYPDERRQAVPIEGPSCCSQRDPVCSDERAPRYATAIGEPIPYLQHGPSERWRAVAARKKKEYDAKKRKQRHKKHKRDKGPA